MWELMLTFSYPWLQIGTPSASVSKEIADVQRLLKRYEGKVTYTMHSAGTTVGANSVVSARSSFRAEGLQRDPGIQ